VNRVVIEAPQPGSNAVKFSWVVEPATGLYRRPSFTLRFPEDVDVSAVSEGLWWRIALICLHSHWPLLRPCRVEMPGRLGAGESAFWHRLSQAVATTLDAYRTAGPPDGEVEIVEGSWAMPAMTRVQETERCATAFSGGKDSLVQTGLLTELTRRPVLVATTSPLPPMEDHLTQRRHHVLSEIARRRDATLIEVHSDYRASWENGFPPRGGWPVSVNEITDTHLYFASLLAVGVALGASHLFLASEAEVQENAEVAGEVVQHPHFMYSTITQRALQALLRPAGVRYSSLTSALHSYQVQTLLWTRYADLRDLQYSCWRVRGEESTCSRCPQCLRLALCALSLGDAPGRMGIDLVRLLTSMRGWRPGSAGTGPGESLPQAVTSRALDGEIASFLGLTPVERVARVLAHPRGRWSLRPRQLTALACYARLRRRMLAQPIRPLPGCRPGFLRLVDPLVRQGVASVYEQHFAPEDETAYAGILDRGDALVRWITEPIGGEG
jgi:hypothetical protein